ncbi:hypothetical protein UlMin_012258 [Ulmus minor]
MSETCNSRHFSWLMKSCFPNPNNNGQSAVISAVKPSAATTISSLPDDLLLECLSRVDHSSISNLSQVCRRWAGVLLSPTFSHLRRQHNLLHHTIYAVSGSDSVILTAALRFNGENTWKISAFLAEINVPVPRTKFHSFPSHARLSAIGNRIFIIGRNATLRFDTWTGTVTPRSPMLLSRKKFAAATVSGKIYVAGGGSRTTAVEEYDPEEDKWRVVAQASRSRFGCIGAAVDGVFYVIGGLKLATGPAPVGSEAHVYANSMDLFVVKTRNWLRSRAVPGGGCVVAACGAAGHVFVLASHAVELSFWSFDARRNSGGFGEWRRISSPPLPAQISVDSTVRFSCVGVGDKVVLVQVCGFINDLLWSGRSGRGFREGLVLVYDTVVGEWRRAANLPEIIRRAACICAEC